MYTICQPVLMVSTSDEKYIFGVPFKVLSKQVGLYIKYYVGVCKVMMVHGLQYYKCFKAFHCQTEILCIVVKIR